MSLPSRITRAGRGRLREAPAERVHATVQIGDGLLEHLPAAIVRGRGELPLQFHTAEAKRFEFAGGFWIAGHTRAGGFLALPFLHAFLNARLCVYQSFSSITHQTILPQARHGDRRATRGRRRKNTATAAGGRLS